MPRKARPKRLTARITHLEMERTPPLRVAAPIGIRLALMRPHRITLPFYRFLYEQVGKPHHWLLRRNATDDDLAAAIHSPMTEIEVLYADGSPAGFYELALDELPEAVEIRYFGLTPQAQGRGLGRFLLSEAIFSGFAHASRKLRIQTNTLDSPRALQLYQKMGFSTVGWSEETVEPWE